MTITGTEAYEAMRSHHELLSEQLSSRAAAVSEAVTAGRPHDAAVADLVGYLAREILPHALAEEETVYPAAAAARCALVGTVNEMAAEHDTLSAAAETLAGQTDGWVAAEQARQVADLFAGHAARENDVLLPVLLSDEDTDLAALLAHMRHRAEEAGKSDRTRKAAVRDPEGALFGLLLEAGRALARADQADLACQLAAAAWAAVREDRPDLAVTATAALHGLARRVTAAPTGPAKSARAQETASPPAGAASEPELDVRNMAPAQRHETIFATYQDLEPGRGFILVNDHDPKPLWYQFEAEQSGQYTWDSIEAGPQVWRVRIGRAPAAAKAGDRGAASGGQFGPGARNAEPDLDVRQIAHFQRHDAIFIAYQALAPGAGFVLINDHDPLPLRYQFEARHADEFTWDYLETGPRTWRVRIGRPGE